MSMHARRRLKVRGVVVDTITVELMFSDGTFEQLATVVIGGVNYARINKFEQLAWPPQIVLAEYGAPFFQKNGQMAYARMLAFNGMLTRVYVMKNAQDRQRAERLLRQMRGVLITKFQDWLAHEVHRKDPTWPQQVRALLHAVDAFGAQQLTLEQLLQRFEKAFEPLGSHHQKRGRKLIREVLGLAASYDWRFARRFPVAYLFRNLRKVEFFMYGDNRDLNVKMITDEAKANMSEAEFLQQQFAQVKTQQAQFKAEQIPFYTAAWLQAQHDFNRSVFELNQLEAYQQGGL
ncbi:hypothetical protein [Lacticaseibacillus porcinae]|uniref:hypothetical protein n=1 Tax=Lacticaseibacillus porcinae TaxID=1123687 RepID=UPI000F76CCCA|nr:hypothetical protein [Lacticaseibacillus porcinae]